ncbi:phage capsid protein [Mesorhizobium sp. PAMC28654]|uniref:phage capsid protein n=1 Tax=Mesorhizobium sp. PAMC28654 TaxID=2880934 RepID=UPI001D0BC4BD|nr:phage capsid protein [Mesorhizobium sp. PAMC28654]UDL89840.1 phage capsid protein [Mesorhizobium sp. PAMC28654]
MTPFEIPAHFNDSYTHNVEMLLQRKGPKFLEAVTMRPYQGEQAQVVKQFGDVAFRDKTTRHSDTQFDDLIHMQRWIFPSDKVLALPVDSQDELRVLDSPLSAYAEAGRMAYGRAVDDFILPAFFGISPTGIKGATQPAFPAGNQIAVNYVESGAAANSGLTIAKLRAARKKLAQNFVDLEVEEAYVGVTAQQVQDLLATTEVTNSLYNQVKALVAGDVDSFMGFKFIKSEAIPVDASNYTRCPVWVKSGLVYGQWEGLITRIGPRPDKDYLTQIHMTFTGGATRTQEGKVLEIKCDPTL